MFDSSESEFLGDSVPPRDLLEWEDNGAYRRVYLTYVPAGYDGVPRGFLDRYTVFRNPSELNAGSLLNERD